MITADIPGGGGGCLRYSDPVCTGCPAKRAKGLWLGEGLEDLSGEDSEEEEEEEKM